MSIVFSMKDETSSNRPSHNPIYLLPYHFLSQSSHHFPLVPNLFLLFFISLPPQYRRNQVFCRPSQVAVTGTGGTQGKPGFSGEIHIPLPTNSVQVGPRYLSLDHKTCLSWLFILPTSHDVPHRTGRNAVVFGDQEKKTRPISYC